MISGRVEKARDVERVLLRLADEFGRKGLLPLRRAVRAALKPALEDLRRATPVETGALRESARLTVSVLRRGAVARGRVGWSSRGGKVRAAQMLGVEFGNRTRRPGRVLSGVFEREQDAIERRFSATLRAELDDALAKAVAAQGGRLRL